MPITTVIKFVNGDTRNPLRHADQTSKAGPVAAISHEASGRRLVMWTRSN